MSNAGASILVMLVLLGLAGYFVFVPPPGFEGIGHRIAIPIVLVVGAFTILESLRMRTHVAQLVGALRGLMGRSGAAPTPEIRRDAIEILIRALRSESPSVRRTAEGELRKLTGATPGEGPEAWESWWEANRGRFGAGR